MKNPYTSNKNNYTSGVLPGFTLPVAKRQKAMSIEEYLQSKVNAAGIELNAAAKALVDEWKKHKATKYNRVILTKDNKRTTIPVWDDVNSVTVTGEVYFNPYLVDWDDNLHGEPLFSVEDLGCLDCIFSMHGNLIFSKEVYHHTLHPLYDKWYRVWEKYYGFRTDLAAL